GDTRGLQAGNMTFRWRIRGFRRAGRDAPAALMEEGIASFDGPDQEGSRHPDIGESAPLADTPPQSAELGDAAAPLPGGQGTSEASAPGVMYEAFYGLAERPFTTLPDPQFLYWSESHQLAFAIL